MSPLASKKSNPLSTNGDADPNGTPTTLAGVKVVGRVPTAATVPGLVEQSDRVSSEKVISQPRHVRRSTQEPSEPTKTLPPLVRVPYGLLQHQPKSDTTTTATSSSSSSSNIHSDANKEDDDYDDCLMYL